MDDLTAGVGVLQLDDVDILGADPRGLVGGAGCVDRGPGRLLHRQPRAVDLEGAEAPGAHRRRPEVDRGAGVAVGILRLAEHDGGRALIGTAEHVLRQRVVQDRRPEDLLLGERFAPEGARVAGPVPVVLGRHLGQRRPRDAVVLHVLVDLHAEELGGRELTLFAVPRRAGVEPGIGAEGPGQVLVHTDGDAEVVLAEANGVGGQGQGAGGGGASVVDVGEGDPGEAHQGDDGVGVVDLVAPGEGELDVAPFDARVGEGAADGDGAHVDGRHVLEAAEGMEADPDDGDVSAVHATGRKAKVTTSSPVSSVRRGVSTSSISMPVHSAWGSDSPSST